MRRAVRAQLVASCCSVVSLPGAFDTASAVTKPCSNVATATTADGKRVKNSTKSERGFQARELGATANISGWTTTVLGGEPVAQARGFADGYLQVTVRICIRNAKAQHWSPHQFLLQTPANTLLRTDPVTILADPGSKLARGERAEADLWFAIGNPAPPGEYYVVFEPSVAFENELRGAWQVIV